MQLETLPVALFYLEKLTKYKQNILDFMCPTFSLTKNVSGYGFNLWGFNSHTGQNSLPDNLITVNILSRENRMHLVFSVNLQMESLFLFFLSPVIDV